MANLGHVLAGYAAVEVGKKAYSDLLAEMVTKPLGMSHTARALCDNPSPLCSEGHNTKGKAIHEMPSGLWTTADDMARFIEAHVGALKVGERTTKAIQLTHGELFRVDATHAVGMAWEIWGSGETLRLTKNGVDAGFTSYVAIEPPSHRGVAVLSNGDGKPPPETLALQLLKLASE